MFGELEVLIPSMLLCSLCYSLNSSTCVIRTSNMAALIYFFRSLYMYDLPRAVEGVKNSFWVPLEFTISASWSMLHT